MKPCWAIRACSPVRDSSTGEVLGMLKIERIDFQDMTLDTLGVFQGVCDWIGMVIANQRHIEELDRRGFQRRQPPARTGGLWPAGSFPGRPWPAPEIPDPRHYRDSPKDLALQPDGLKRFAAALGEAAVEVGGPSASPSTGRPTNLSTSSCCPIALMNIPS